MPDVATSKKLKIINSHISDEDIQRLYSGCIEVFASNSYKIKDKCWLWQRAVTESGYGIMQVTHPELGVATIDTHRLSWRIHNGEIPAGNYYINHHCDVRRCVNPDHLYLGTSKENAQDRVIRNRSNQSTLTEDDIKKIRHDHLVYNYTHEKLSKIYDVSVKTISDIINYNTWAHVKPDTNDPTAAIYNN